MLNITEFKNEFIHQCRNELRNAFPLYMDIEERIVHKAQLGDLTGLAFISPHSPGAPTLYVEDFYALYCSGHNVEHLSKEAVSSVISSLDILKELPVDFDVSRMRELLRIRMIRVRGNESLLLDAPHQLVTEDLALVVYAETDEYRALITNGMMEGSDIDEEELFAVASERTSKVETAVLFDIADAVYEEDSDRINYLEMKHVLSIHERSVSGKLFVLSNENMYWGASALFYPDIIAKIHSLLGESFYVIPSSVHELMLCSTEGSDPEHLRNVLRSANRDVVEDCDTLSDNICICDSGMIQTYDGRSNAPAIPEKTEAGN